MRAGYPFRWLDRRAEGFSGRMGGGLTIQEGRIWVAKEAVWNTFGAYLGRENGLIVQNAKGAGAFISEQFCY